MTVQITGGCVRLYPTGPEWHVNSAHKAVGFVDTSVNPYIDSSGHLVIDLVDENGDANPHPVIYMDAGEDETLTARGISAGCSSGTQEVRITFYKDGVNGADGTELNLNNPVHWSRVSGTTANIWFIHYAYVS